VVKLSGQFDQLDHIADTSTVRASRPRWCATLPLVAGKGLVRRRGVHDCIPMSARPLLIDAHPPRCGMHTYDDFPEDFLGGRRSRVIAS
jgi:hypothetical protein